MNIHHILIKENNNNNRKKEAVTRCNNKKRNTKQKQKDLPPIYKPYNHYYDIHSFFLVYGTTNTIHRLEFPFITVLHYFFVVFLDPLGD